MAISFKNLDVYKLALEFIELVAEIVKLIPRGQSYLADQIKRSAASIAQNIGEGAGEFAKKEKIRFYRMALRSATESSSTIDIVYRFGIIEKAFYNKADKLAERLVSMLTKLIHRHSAELNDHSRVRPLNKR